MLYKFLRGNKFLRVLLSVEFLLTLWYKKTYSTILRSMTKIAIKYEDIVPYDGIFM